MTIRWQMALMRSYRDMDLLGCDAQDPQSVDRAVAEHKTGDTLFEFLWRELSDDIDLNEAIKRLGMAEDDIAIVRGALEEIDETENNEDWVEDDEDEE